MKRFLQSAALGVGMAILLGVAGCSSDSEAPKEAAKEAAKPVEPVTGQTALFEIYKVARMWATDLQVMELHDMLLDEKQAEPGKSFAWAATFYSPGKSVSRMYSYSVKEFSQTLHKGVRAGDEEPFRLASARTKPFAVNAVRVDSPDAYKTALEHGKDYADKHKDLPVITVLERPQGFEYPAWRLVWGASVGVSNFSIYVDAYNGKFLKTMH